MSGGLCVSFYWFVLLTVSICLVGLLCKVATVAEGN